MENLEKYQKMLEKDKEIQKKFYSVIVDGNRHDDLKHRIVTVKELITIEKCKNICNKIKETYPEIDINEIKINITQYDYNITANDYSLIMSGDIGIEVLGLRKEAIYFCKKNCLRIWEDGLPIYENNNGVITRDRDALADCLC